MAAATQLAAADPAPPAAQVERPEPLDAEEWWGDEDYDDDDYSDDDDGRGASSACCVAPGMRQDGR